MKKLVLVLALGAVFSPVLAHAEAGVDINLRDGWLINADIKYITIHTDVKLKLATGWTKVDSLDVDPWVFGIGIGKKF